MNRGNEKRSTHALPACGGDFIVSVTVNGAIEGYSREDMASPKV